MLLLYLLYAEGRGTATTTMHIECNGMCDFVRMTVCCCCLLFWFGIKQHTARALARCDLRALTSAYQHSYEKPQNFAYVSSILRNILDLIQTFFYLALLFSVCILRQNFRFLTVLSFTLLMFHLITQTVLYVAIFYLKYIISLC